MPTRLLLLRAALVALSARSWSPPTPLQQLTTSSRRALLQRTIGAVVTTTMPGTTAANAKATTTPRPRAEVYAKSPKVLPRALRIRVSDAAALGKFLEKACSMKKVAKNAYAYGPTSLERPADFYPGVSGFDADGAHVAFVLEESSDELLSDGVLYVQLAVPSLRASRILGNGGKVKDSYGIINVAAPGCGDFPFRLILGDEVRDRAMFVALGVQNVDRAAAFYTSRGLFQRMPYPHGRPETKVESAFDPYPPRSSIYLAPAGAADNSAGFGILLVPTTKDRFTGRYAKPLLGNVYQGLDLLLDPDQFAFGDAPSKSGVVLRDPDGYPLTLFPASSSSAPP